MNIEIPKEFFTVAKNLFREDKKVEATLNIQIDDKGTRVICGIGSAAIEFSSIHPSMSGKKLFIFDFPEVLPSGKKINVFLDYEKGEAKLLDKTTEIGLKIAENHLAQPFFNLMSRERVSTPEKYIYFNPRYYKNLAYFDDDYKHSVIKSIKTVAGCPSVFSWVKPLENNSKVIFLIADVK